MNEKFELKKLEQISYQDTMEDGLGILFVGVMLLITGLMIIDDIFVLFGSIAYIFSLIGATYLQKKFTHPRIGYVQPRIDKSDLIIKLITLGILVIIGGIVSVILIVFFGNEGSELWFNSLHLGLSLVLGLGSLHYGRKTGQIFYYLGAIILLLSGIIFMFINLNKEFLKFGIFSFLWGIILSMVGLAMFIRFIRKYPVLNVEENQYLKEES